MALPKLSTGALNIYADPHLGSEISPTTSPAASSKQEDSDPNYTLNYEEPVLRFSSSPAPYIVTLNGDGTVSLENSGVYKFTITK